VLAAANPLIPALVARDEQAPALLALAATCADSVASHRALELEHARGVDGGGRLGEDGVGLVEIRDDEHRLCRQLRSLLSLRQRRPSTGS
jgi:hypothetical protein